MASVLCSVRDADPRTRTVAGGGEGGYRVSFDQSRAFRQRGLPERFADQRLVATWTFYLPLSLSSLTLSIEPTLEQAFQLQVNCTTHCSIALCAGEVAVAGG